VAEAVAALEAQEVRISPGGKGALRALGD
jgi:hypothetical protein